LILKRIKKKNRRLRNKMTDQILRQPKIREWKTGETLDSLVPGVVAKFNYKGKTIATNGYVVGLYKGKLDNRNHMIYSRLSDSRLEVWEIENGLVSMEEGSLRFRFDYANSKVFDLTPDNDPSAFECTNQQLLEAGL
jgi:hypothetical protein